MHTVVLKKSASKKIAKFPVTDRKRIGSAISGLAEDPRPDGATKLRGGNSYRIRVGDYRVIYEIDDSVLLVTVLAAGQRGRVYDR